MDAFVIFSLVRISAALLIIRWPLVGVLASTLLDGYDWDFLHLTKNFNFDFYQNWDKAMDITYLTVAALTLRNWKDILAKKIAVGFYALRASGVFLYFILGIKPLLFFFPNIFENFFIWCFLYRKFSGKENILPSKLIWIVIILFIAVPKIIHEYVMHIKNTQLWDIIDFNIIDKSNETIRQYANWLGWGSLFYIIPFSIAFLVALSYKKKY